MLSYVDTALLVMLITLQHPQPEAEGGARAIADAWNELNLDTDHVYINAHGTGTPLNDKAETVAIKKRWEKNVHVKYWLVLQNL